MLLPEKKSLVYSLSGRTYSSWDASVSEVSRYQTKTLTDSCSFKMLEQETFINLHIQIPEMLIILFLLVALTEREMENDLALEWELAKYNPSLATMDSVSTEADRIGFKIDPLEYR